MEKKTAKTIRLTEHQITYIKSISKSYNINFSSSTRKILDEHSELASKCSELSSQVASLQTENIKLETTNNQKEHQIAELKQNIQSLKESNKQQNDQIEELSRQVQKLSTKPTFWQKLKNLFNFNSPIEC